MSDERQDTRDLIARAAPELGVEVRQRAMVAMAAVGVVDSPSRPRRLATALGAALVLLAVGFVPYSATDSQARVASALAAAQRSAMTEEAPQRLDPEVMSDPKRAAEFYGRQAVEYVERNCPGDPEMLMAAGLLAPDAKAGLELLRQAIRLDSRPARHAAYVQKLAMTGPKYFRPALIPVDPGAADFAARVKEFFQGEPEFAKIPEMLTAQSVKPVLEAIRAWQTVEPQNAVPPALRCWYLYGLHRDAEAFRAWEEGGRLPVVDGHQGETLHAVVALLSRMGMSQTTLGFYLFAGGNPLPSFTPQLRDDARIALFEGRKAQLDGRPKEAIAWWNATLAVGRHMGESAKWISDYLAAGAIEGTGALPSWRRVNDRGIGSHAPHVKGGWFLGEQHAFYVSQVGKAEDEAVRDSLVRGRERADLLKESLQRTEWQDTPFLRGQVLLFLACFAVGVLAFLLLVYGGISVRHRHAADAASVLGGRVRLWIAVVGLAPALVSGVVLWRWMPNSTMGSGVADSFTGGLVLCVVLTLLLPLWAAQRRRAPEARVYTAWRGNLRRVLPISVLLFALVALTLAMVGRQERARWIRDVSSGRYSEMAWVIGLVGQEKWSNPPIPKDAWRAEAPPDAGKQSAVSRP